MTSSRIVDGIHTMCEMLGVGPFTEPELQFGDRWPAAEQLLLSLRDSGTYADAVCILGWAGLG